MKKILFAVIAAAFALTTFAACTPQEEANPMTYTNEEQGYSLTFPESWTGYVVTAGPGAMQFGLPGDENLFIISAHSKEEWEAMQKEEGPKPTMLGENDEYVFGYEIGNGGPKAGSEAAFDEIQTVIGTFEVK